MFPLSTVLFPGAHLPLQVFEPRYWELIDSALAGENRFGVVLIERGPEVGGGDIRTGVGTIAEIVDIGEAGDGRILVMAVGKERIRVVEWCDDDPYPLAVVESYPDSQGDEGLAPLVARVLAAWRRLLALAVEMGAAGQNLDLDLPDDPLQASWGLCAAAPVGPFDRQQLLETAGSRERMLRLERMLTDQTEVLEAALREE